jgi:hypothetical protein
LKPATLKPSLAVGGSLLKPSPGIGRTQDALFPSDADATPKTHETGLYSLLNSSPTDAQALVPIQARNPMVVGSQTLPVVPAATSQANSKNMIASVAGNVLDANKTTVAAPAAASLVSHQTMKSTSAGFSENMRRLSQQVYREAENHAADIRKENALLNDTLRQFVQQSFAAIKPFEDLYRQVGSSEVIDQALVDKVAQKQAMMQEIIGAYQKVARQLVEMDNLVSTSKFAKYKNAGEYLFNAKLKELQVLTSMLEVARQQENHEMKVQIEYRTTAMKEEAQRYDQFFRLIELTQKAEQNDQQQLLELEKQRSEFMLQHQSQRMEYEKSRAELMQKSEFDTRKLSQQHEEEQAKLDLQMKSLEVQDEQAKLRLGAEERIQLANLAVQEIISQRMQDAELKKEEARQSGETVRSIITEAGKLATPVAAAASAASSCTIL